MLDIAPSFRADSNPSWGKAGGQVSATISQTALPVSLILDVKAMAYPLGGASSFIL